MNTPPQDSHDEWFDGPDTDRTPFEAPSARSLPNQQPSTDPSVYNEPWMRAGQTPMHGLADDGPEQPAPPDPESSVWDEPGLSPQLSGDVPSDGLTWYRWAEDQRLQTTLPRSFVVTAVVAVSSGLLAILGTILLQGADNALVLMVVGAPIVEETMKIGLTIWVVEKRPWLFLWRGQIFLCGLISGVVFAAIENVMYLSVFIPNPTDGIVLWRWTICVLLHAGCSSLAALGAMRVWSESRRRQRQPQLVDGARWLVAAMLCHGIYNAGATVLQLSGFTF